MEIGDGVNKLGVRVGLQSRFQLIQVHAVLFHGHPHQFGAEGAERVERTDKAGSFADDDIARIAKHLGGHLHSLLRAGGDEDFIEIPANGMLFLHIRRQVRPQRRVSFRYAILKRRNRVFVKNAGGNSRDSLRRESLGRWISGGQRHHLRVGCVFQNLADCRGVEPLNLSGKGKFHICTILSQSRGHVRAGWIQTRRYQAKLRANKNLILYYHR